MIYAVVDRETIDPVSSSVGITSTLITAQVTYAVIQALGGDIRFTIDGTTPTTSLGMRLTENSKVELWGDQAMSNFRCIDDGGVATVEVITMGRGA